MKILESKKQKNILKAHNMKLTVGAWYFPCLFVVVVICQNSISQKIKWNCK